MQLELSVWGVLWKCIPTNPDGRLFTPTQVVDYSHQPRWQTSNPTLASQCQYGVREKKQASSPRREGAFS